MSIQKQPETNDPLSTIALIERTVEGKRQGGRLNWWYRLAAPAEPTAAASLREREAWRRGRYISNTLLGMISILGVVIVVIGGFVNHSLLPNLALTFLFLWAAVFFNKRGNVIVSGIIVVLVFDTSLMLTLLSFGNLTAFLLPLLDLLVIPELFAASLLPSRFVFLDMLFHIAFYICTLTFLFPKDPVFAAQLHNPNTFADALIRPVVIQLVTAIISYTWMKSVTQSVERADRATSIALLEREVSAQAQLEAEQKNRLEKEIQAIIDVQTQVANGRLDARVPLTQGNVLWSVSGALNNLISRFQSLQREYQRLEQMELALRRFYHMRSQVQNSPMPWQPTGTSVDVLVQQHNALSMPLEQGKNQLTTLQ